MGEVQTGPILRTGIKEVKGISSQEENLSFLEVTQLPKVE
jgi:hypothetical protein